MRSFSLKLILLLAAVLNFVLATRDTEVDGLETDQKEDPVHEPAADAESEKGGSSEPAAAPADDGESAASEHGNGKCHIEDPKMDLKAMLELLHKCLEERKTLTSEAKQLVEKQIESGQKYAKLATEIDEIVKKVSSDDSLVKPYNKDQDIVVKALVQEVHTVKIKAEEVNKPGESGAEHSEEAKPAEGESHDDEHGGDHGDDQGDKAHSEAKS
eukprot:gb/GFBE01029331.1/.p1 GENE.gb/GFBE01029331.1/~~gb/GFBE01029331.1/.p1  ORF type:complete len:214 (+),score=64.43 gb/GFBE01029331.1/:1-642(+)